MSTSFHVGEITVMAARVKRWRKSEEGNILRYNGAFRPKRLSPKKANIEVERRELQGDGGRKFEYSVSVTYDKEKVAELKGEIASFPFDYIQMEVNKKRIKAEEAARDEEPSIEGVVSGSIKKRHEAINLKMVQELRATMGCEPEKTSVQTPLTLEEVLGIAQKMGGWKRVSKKYYDDRFWSEYSVTEYSGKHKTPNSRDMVRVIAGICEGYSNGFDVIPNKFSARVYFKRAEVASLREDAAEKVYQYVQGRKDQLDAEKQERQRQAKADGLKRAVFGDGGK